MKKTALYMLFIALMYSCAAPTRNATELVGVGGIAWSEPAPYGMVLVKRGSINMGEQEVDSLWNQQPAANGVSVDAFWIDETEITNSKYKQYIFWVRDSIIRERLADPAYGGNEAFKIEEDRLGNPITPRLNWARPIPWRNATEDEMRAIASVYRNNPITGRLELDASQMNYRYEIYDHAQAALRRNRLDASRRVLNTDVKVNPEQQVLISKDTAYISEEGRIMNETIVRPLSSEWDFVHTRMVNIYPDTTVWVNDFENSYNEPYMRNYFAHPGYNNYPVVGVSWEQATAFCVWRTNLMEGVVGGRVGEPFRLPTEAEWEYAARAGKPKTTYPWSSSDPMAAKGCFYANFKPEKGNYVKDGNLITAGVGSYSANDFGLFDMAGNVSEWTSTAYTETPQVTSADINPEFRYDAAKEDPYVLKRKIVRGGSWKDIATFVRSDLRMWEYQNEQRSYVGFRCVRSYMGFGRGKK